MAALVINFGNSIDSKNVKSGCWTPQWRHGVVVGMSERSRKGQPITSPWDLVVHMSSLRGRDVCDSCDFRAVVDNASRLPYVIAGEGNTHPNPAPSHLMGCPKALPAWHGVRLTPAPRTRRKKKFPLVANHAAQTMLAALSADAPTLPSASEDFPVPRKDWSDFFQDRVDIDSRIAVFPRKFSKSRVRHWTNWLLSGLGDSPFGGQFTARQMRIMHSFVYGVDSSERVTAHVPGLQRPVHLGWARTPNPRGMKRFLKQADQWVSKSVEAWEKMVVQSKEPIIHPHTSTLPAKTLSTKTPAKMPPMKPERAREKTFATTSAGLATAEPNMRTFDRRFDRRFGSGFGSYRVAKFNRDFDLLGEILDEVGRADGLSRVEPTDEASPTNPTKETDPVPVG